MSDAEFQGPKASNARASDVQGVTLPPQRRRSARDASERASKRLRAGGVDAVPEERPATAPTERGKRIEALDDAMTQMRKARGRGALSDVETSTVLHVYLALKREHVRSEQKKGKRSAFDVAGRVAQLTGFSVVTVRRVYAHYNKARKHGASVSSDDVLRSSSVRPGNHERKRKRIPATRRLAILVREFVRERRRRKRRVVARHVMDLLRDNDVIEIKRGADGVYQKKDYKAALRATQRYVHPPSRLPSRMSLTLPTRTPTLR